MAGKQAPVMDIVSVADAIEWQARHAEEGGAPGTGRVIRGLLAILDGDTATARRISNWQGLALKDAMPLRIAGGLHNLVLTGADDRLARVYSGQITDQPSIDRLICELVETYDARLLPWLDGPPQTNEAGRSASLMAGLMWLSERVCPRFEMLEIGSSAGINTMMERYRFALGGIAVGPENSPMRIEPEWRGTPPPDTRPEIVSIRGCDVAPVDLSDPQQALRLKSYVWPEATHRMARIDAAIDLASETPPDVVKLDAGSFVVEALEREQESGVTRVLFHSIVWQYVPDDQQQSIRRAIEQAADSATNEKPLAWMSLETNRETFKHELVIRYWPGDGEKHLLGTAHPHGAWVEWMAS
ncbi:DUF2332 domain-containing protein [Altererythrobacter sp.]|uniref:DUF2332 domain-containing protein n=1 Tax=Altererythrobacter sp. TaxID=1872480 RepID=UPI003D0B2CDE